MRKDENWLSRNTACMVDLWILFIWGIMTVYIVGRFVNIIKASQGVDFSGVLGIYAGVTGLATQVVSFHRGSSKSSEDKTKMMNNIMESNSNPPASVEINNENPEIKIDNRKGK